MLPSVAVIGGGAGGSFCAIEISHLLPGAKVVLFEKHQTLLSKVKISGGGRCNVTHAEFDPKKLISSYPRGASFLLPLFYRFQPRDTIEWFAKEGIHLVAECDGRMFPHTNSSSTVIECFMRLFDEQGIEVVRGVMVDDIIERAAREIVVATSTKEYGPFDAVVMATGSASSSLKMIEKLGIKIVPQVPSLFTFNCPASPFLDLSGISLGRVEVSLPEISQAAIGPLLMTHWGFSGPAILKLSAFSARDLAEKEYRTSLVIDWVPEHSFQELKSMTALLRKGELGKKQLKNLPLVPSLPKALFERLASLASIDEAVTWSMVSNAALERLFTSMKKTKLAIDGKSTYKNEFVTAGGVCLDEVSQKTVSSKKYPWLFFTGEVLDIDGVTGGFNFQAAWTTAWCAACGVAQYHFSHS